MDIKENIAGNLREIRAKKQFTLDEASRLTDVSRSMLSAIEKGDVNPTIFVIWKIANRYKVKFSSIVEEKRNLPHHSCRGYKAPDRGRFHPLFRGLAAYIPEYRGRHGMALHDSVLSATVMREIFSHDGRNGNRAE